MLYDCIIVGGGIAGLQAAIQLGRYKHKVLVIDSNNGRSNICRAYHNLLGWPDGVSGQELRNTGKHQAEQLGVEFMEDTVIHADKHENGFVLKGKENIEYNGKRLLLATGVMDRLPDFPDLFPCLGISVYVCPDCDGYEVKDKLTIVLGAGKVGANMALTLSYWTEQIVYINHGKLNMEDSIEKQLKSKRINYFNESIKEILAQGSSIKGVVLESGKQVVGEHAFIAFGGNEIRSELANLLGVTLHENKHILVDPRTKMTNVEHVWAAGDVVAHSEQVTIAMGEGSQAAIWIHKSLING